MTESHSLGVPDPTVTMRQEAAEDLKKCWVNGTGVLVGKDGQLNEHLLASLSDLQALVAYLLADQNLDLTQPAVLHAVLRTIHPSDADITEELMGAPREYLESRDARTRVAMAWAIGVLMRIDGKYPQNAGGTRRDTPGSGRRRYIDAAIGINPFQLNDPKNESDKRSKSLDVFREAYIDHLVEQLTTPETRDRVVRTARAKMQESAVREPTADAPVTRLRPATPTSQVDGSAEADTHASARDTEAEEGGATNKAGAETGWTRYWKHLAAFGAVIALVIGGTIIFVHRGSGSARPSVVAGATTVAPSSTDQAAPGIPLSPDHVCENSPPATAVGQVKVEICVEYWCTGDFHAANGVDTIPGRGQIKLRPLLFNKSPFAVDISISPNAAIRLLVVTPKDPSVWWQPPPVTSQAGDRPVPIKWNGQDTWAVPPNAPHDAVRIDLPGNMYTYDGFATFWDFTMLAPGETAFKPLRFDDQHHAIQEGDLVFNVPLDDQRASTARALVLVDRNDPTKILASSDTTTWPRPSDLNSF